MLARHIRYESCGDNMDREGNDIGLKWRQFIGSYSFGRCNVEESNTAEQLGDVQVMDQVSEN
jgi:hypothetical protein